LSSFPGIAPLAGSVTGGAIEKAAGGNFVGTGWRIGGLVGKLAAGYSNGMRVLAAEGLGMVAGAGLGYYRGGVDAALDWAGVGQMLGGLGGAFGPAAWRAVRTCVPSVRSALSIFRRPSRLYVHLTEHDYQEVLKTGYLGHPMPTAREVLLWPLAEGRIWATPYSLAQLRRTRLLAFLSGLAPRRLSRLQHTIELTDEAASVFTLAFGPTFSAQVFGWSKAAGRQFRFRGRRVYKWSGSVSSLDGAILWNARQTALLRAGEVERLALMLGVPTAIAVGIAAASD
jgi:hypothetical protein